MPSTKEVTNIKKLMGTVPSTIILSFREQKNNPAKPLDSELTPSKPPERQS